MRSNLSNSGSGPLKLSAAERHAFLAKHKMEMGWLLLTRAEMNAMKQAMEGATKENERLNQQAARMIAERITPGTLPKWSEEPPKALGWYWWCGKDSNARQVILVADLAALPRVGGKWCGPVLEPEEEE